MGTPASTTVPGREVTLSRACWLVIITAAALLVFWQLGSGPLVEFDEFYTAERSREMLATGFPLKVQENFDLNVLKPPLHYALTGAALAIVPDREAALRLWPALFGWGSIVLAGLLTRKLSGGWTPAAPLASLLLMASFLFWSQSRSALLDTGCAFFALLTLFPLIAAQTNPRAWLVAGAIAALGTLQKYPLPLLPMLVFVVVYSIHARSLRPLKTPWLWTGLALSALGFVGWFFVQALNSSGTFVLRAFERQFFQRAAESEAGGYHSSFAYYFDLMTGDYTLAVPLLLGALAAVFVVRSLHQRPALLGTALSALLLLIGLGLMSKHSERYLVALYPLLAVTAATALGLLAGKHRLAACTLAALLLLPCAWRWPAQLAAWNARPQPQAPAVRLAPGFAAAIEPDEQVILAVSGDTQYDLHVGSILFYGDFQQKLWFLNLDGVESIRPYFTDNVRGIAHVRDLPVLEANFPHFQIVAQDGDIIHFTAKAPAK